LTVLEKYALFRSIFPKEEAEKLSHKDLSMDRLAKILDANLKRVGNDESRLCDKFRAYCRVVKRLTEKGE